MTFREYLEARGDAANLRRLGISTFGMHTVRPPGPDPEEVEDAEFLVVQAPPTAPPNIQKLNGQIVSRDRQMIRDDGRIAISPLRGRNDEGQWYFVQRDWVVPANEDEIQHGDWLNKTFFHRDDYVAPEQRASYQLTYIDGTDPSRHQVLLRAFQTLRDHPDCQGFADRLYDDFYRRELWLVAADLLDDIDYDTRELRTVLN